MVKFKSLLSVLVEATVQNQKVKDYVDFLTDEVPDMLDQESQHNAEALKVVNKEFAEIIAANPKLIEDQHTVTEMSRTETMDIFGLYAQIMDKKIRAKLGSLVNKEAAEKLHDIVISIAQNIRDYPNVMAAIALELTSTPYYQESM